MFLPLRKPRLGLCMVRCSRLCARWGTDADADRARAMEAQTGPSQASSPPATWDLLYAAAGEVARMRMNEDVYGLNHGRGLLGPLRKPSPVALPVKNNPNSDVGFVSHQSLSHQQLQMQATQFQQLRQQQMMRQQGDWTIPTAPDDPGNGLKQREEQRVRRSQKQSPSGLSPSAWPTQQMVRQPSRARGAGPPLVWFYFLDFFIVFYFL
ncbi:uncharacterized protein LOC132172502 isoform X2 [Corylus avellana]|uniref:uncharacterized protein LOC132172502 isoform X2 n=1 Tax=Corylus avellana TaxID=13451 RepID=UPI00286B216F|nr:uncharacterized protein LOC132172502 isoform X2 [Corylus avellana]